MTFVDLTKAFGTVSREGLWKVMTKCLAVLQIHSNGAAVPRWYACKGTIDGEFFLSIPCDK